MAMLKIGKEYFNNQERPVFLLTGTAVRDAESAPVNGKDHTKVSIAAAKDADGNSLYVTLNGWRTNAGNVLAIKKLDNVLAVGQLKTSEYNGRTYYDMDVELIVKSGAGFESSDKLSELAKFPGVKFTEIEADEDDYDGLPF